MSPGSDGFVPKPEWMGVGKIVLYQSSGCKHAKDCPKKDISASDAWCECKYWEAKVVAHVKDHGVVIEF